MSRMIANVGGSRNENEHPFASFMFWAVEAAQSVKSVACRIGWPEETIRRYRDGSQSPPWDKVVKSRFRFTQDERIALARQIAGDVATIEPLSPDQLDRNRQTQLIGTDELHLRGEGIALARAVQVVQEVIHESLEDGQVDETERQRMDQALNHVAASEGRLRDGFFGRVITRLSRVFGGRSARA